MSSGEAPSGPSAAKLAGIALIGIGLLAGVFGVAATVADNGGNVAAPPPTRESQAAPASPQPSSQPRPERPDQPTSTPQQPEPSRKPAPNQPPPNNPPSSNPRDPNAPARVVVRVYNNSTIEGLAHQAADDFRQAGYEIAEVGNYSAGIVYTTTIYYRPGTEEESQAREVASRFGARVEPRFPGITDASPGVIAIITNDYKQGLAAGGK